MVTLKSFFFLLRRKRKPRKIKKKLGFWEDNYCYLDEKGNLVKVKDGLEYRGNEEHI